MGQVEGKYDYSCSVFYMGSYCMKLWPTQGIAMGLMPHNYYRIQWRVWTIAICEINGISREIYTWLIVICFAVVVWSFLLGSFNEFTRTIFSVHNDVIKWKHFLRCWPFVRGIHRPPVNTPHKGQWRGALMFCLICDWINSWVNNREAADLRRHRAHHHHSRKVYLSSFSNSVTR